MGRYADVIDQHPTSALSRAPYHFTGVLSPMNQARSTYAMQFQTRKRIVQTPRPGASPPPPAPPSSQLLRRLQQETLRRQRFLEARRAQTALEEERRRQTALRERRLHRLEQSRAIRARMTTPDRNRTIDRNPPESVVTAPVQLPSRRAPEPAIERMTSYARSSGDRFRMLAPVRVPPSVVGDHKSIRSEPVYFPHDDHDENEIMRTLDRLNQTLAALRLRRSINAESPPPPPPGTVNDDAPPADDDEHRQQQQEPLPGSSVMLPVIQARRQQWQPVPLKPQLARVPNARSRRARGR